MSDTDWITVCLLVSMMYTSESHFLPSQPPYLNNDIMFITSDDREKYDGYLYKMMLT